MKSNLRSERHIIVLMATSLVGVAVFLGYWLYQSYQQEKHLLRREVDHLMIMSARSVESDLIHQIDSIIPPFGMSRSYLNRDSLYVKKIIHGNGASPWKAGSTKKRAKRFETQQAMRENRNYPGVAGFYIGMSERIAGTYNNDIGKGVEILIGDAFDEIVADKKLPRKTRIIFFNGDSSLHIEGITSRPYRDMTVNINAQVQTEEFDGYLLKAILPKLIMSLLLLFLVSYAFYLLYKNLMEAQVLAADREELIANITHELNTPITSAGLALESLLTRPMDEAGRNEYLMLAAGEVKRLSSLVDKIMAGIGDANTNALQRQPLNANNLISDVLASMKLKIEQMNGSVIVHSNHSTIMIHADQLELTGVIQNLIDNGLKYSQPRPEIIIELTESADHVKLAISDNGIGIPKELRSQVFEPFYRVPTGNLHDVKGHGLGLNFVKKVIDAHKGRISIAEAVGGGTMIEITIPSQIS